MRKKEHKDIQYRVAFYYGLVTYFYSLRAYSYNARRTKKGRRAGVGVVQNDVPAAAHKALVVITLS